MRLIFAEILLSRSFLNEQYEEIKAKLKKCQEIYQKAQKKSDKERAG